MDLNFTPIRPFWPQIDLWWPLKGHDIVIFGISRKNAIHWYVFHQHLSVFLSRRICIFGIIWLIDPIWPLFDLWWPRKGHDIDIFGISRKYAFQMYVFHQDLIVFSLKSQFRSISGHLTSIWPLKGQNSTKPRAEMKSSSLFLTTSGFKMVTHYESYFKRQH